MDEYLSTGEIDHIAEKADWPKNKYGVFSPKRPAILNNTKGRLLKLRDNGGNSEKYIFWNKGPVAWWKLDVSRTLQICKKNILFYSFVKCTIFTC